MRRLVDKGKPLSPRRGARKALAEAGETNVLDTAIADFASELALVIGSATAPAAAIAVVDDHTAFDAIAIALTIDARHFGDVGAAITAAAAFDRVDALADCAAAVAIAVIVVAIA